jgi:flagellar hook-associated protein 1
MSFHLLGVARTAIQIHERAVSTTAHNISNAHTDGYTRRRLNLQANAPVLTQFGSFGTGVRMTGLERIRSEWLDVSFRGESANASGSALRRDLLAQVEGVFGEPSEQGLSAAFDRFWSSWSDLANMPTSDSARAAIRQNAEHIASTLHGYVGRLDALRQNTNLRLDAAVGDINALTKQIGDLNRQIVAAEVNGHVAGDLRDARDQMIDQLSKLGPIQVVDRADGSNSVILGTTTIVDGIDSKPLVARNTGTAENPRWGIFESGRATDPVRIDRGEIGEMIGLLNNDLPSIRRQLDTLAEALVRGVNHLHEQGDPPGAPIFDPEMLGAGTIRVSDAVRADATLIRAGLDGPGDNSIALAMAGLRDRVPVAFDANGEPQQLLGGKAFAAYYQDLVTTLGLQVSASDRDAAVAETLAHQALLRRESVTGVSIDEEMIQLIRHQQAYTAAARLVNTADEMMKTILQMV